MDFDADYEIIMHIMHLLALSTYPIDIHTTHPTPLQFNVWFHSSYISGNLTATFLYSKIVMFISELKYNPNITLG